ncbi:MAG: T9SS type A sorting domain-containing protein [Bacteroidales bacterium]|nr:T9SS type A sorting domain-containing protein [Bacteroidales bacterium]
MKKFAFTLVLALICLISVSQQPHKFLQERMQQGLLIGQISELMPNWMNYSERFDSLVCNRGDERQVICYLYDDHSHLIENTLINYVNNILEDGMKNVYSYDENGNCILEAEYRGFDDQWIEMEKREYTYDANGNRLSQLDYSYGEPIRKYIWTYNNDNQCLIEERWYFYSTEYVPEFRIENTYDANGNLMLCLRQQGEWDGTWINYKKEEYAYDIYNNLISETSYKWYSISPEWIEEERITYSYDANNNLICKMVYGDVTIEKIECFYDESNHLILSISTRFGSSNYWENLFKSEYEYDQSDSLVNEVHYIGKGSYYEQSWHPNSKIEYVRNNGGYTICLTNSRSHSVSDDSLYYETRYLYDYDSYNRMVSMAYLRWNSNENDFIFNEKEVCEFDANGNVNEYTFYEYEDGDWIIDESFENTYDLTVDAANILGLSMIYNEAFSGIVFTDENHIQNKWLSCRFTIEDEEELLLTLYYSGYYDVDENESTSLKVYSSEGTLSVENDNITDIQVFDMLGRLVAQQNQVTQCRFNLKPGVYVVKAGNASVKAVVK